MSDVKRKRHIKRNIVLAAVLLFVGTAAYLNWSYNARWGTSSTAMARAEDEMMAEAAAEYVGAQEDPRPVSDYFAEARLTRQQSRDQALSLLETAACAESASQDVIDTAMNDITVMANWSLLESKIENELLAKNFTDCVVYLSADGCTIAVPAPVEGLNEADVARVTDAVLSNTDYSASQINVIEVMYY